MVETKSIDNINKEEHQKDTYNQESIVDTIKLTDLIDPSFLQEFQNAFSVATGMASLTVDNEGPITEGSNFTKFCMNYTRASEIGAQRCNECDIKGGEEAAKTGKPSVYYCHAGLMDFGAPIIVQGQQIGSILGGQVLPEPPDLDKFREIAEQIGVDPEEYVEAAKQIKIVPKEQIEAAANLLFIVANALSSLGYQKFLTATWTREITSIINQITNNTDSLQEKILMAIEHKSNIDDIAKEVIQHQDESRNKIKQTDKILSFISSIAGKSNILGINASIEAARAGNEGKGFKIVAEEIRKMSNNSLDASGQIKNIIEDLNESSLKVNEKVNSMIESSSKESEAVESLKNLIEKNIQIAKTLEEISHRLINL